MSWQETAAGLQALLKEALKAGLRGLEHHRTAQCFANGFANGWDSFLHGILRPREEREMSPRRRVKRRRRRTSLLLSPPSTRECQVRLPTVGGLECLECLECLETSIPVSNLDEDHP